MSTKYELMTEYLYNIVQAKKARGIGRNDEARTIEDANRNLEKEIEQLKGIEAKE